MFPPVCATDDGPVFATDTSELAATPACVVVTICDWLLAVLSSGDPLTEAWFWNVSVLVVLLAGTETTIVTVAELLPAANVPRLQPTVLVPVQAAPCDGVADTNVVPAGNVSLTTTPVEA